MRDGVSPETCWASYKYGIINFDTLLRLVGFFCMNWIVNFHRTSFDREITTIATTPQLLLLRPTALQKAVVLVDCKSAIQTVASNKQATTQTLKEARGTIKLLIRLGKTVAFQWVPSHKEYMATKQLTYWQKKEPHFKTNKHHLTLKQSRDS